MLLLLTILCQLRGLSNISTTTPTLDHSRQIICAHFKERERENRSFRLIVLKNNGLSALIVHDPNTEFSSAAMEVHVGSLMDPKGFEGIAHATEHCLFLCT